MVLNAAVQMLREADELKDKISKFKSGTSMLQERSLWTTQQQLQKIYQKVLILDLDYALDKKVEQDLWNVGFKQQIEALQAISKDKKNPLRSEGQAMLSWVLQAAAGFYLCLLHQICTAFQLDLPFRRRASLLGYVEGWGASETGAGCAGREPAPGAARYIAQHCLVHLGDLARYRHQLRVAHTFYRHALAVCPHSGQPYNQLALVMLSRGRRVCAVYWHVRSLLVRAPFPPAAANLARALAPKHTETPTPCLPGVTSPATPPPPTVLKRMDANTFATEFLRAVHYIHHAEQLETAKALVDALSTAMISLFATDTFESMTLIKISCIIMWIVEETRLEGGALATERETRAATLAAHLARSMLLALLLPHRTADNVQPPIKVWLQWMWCNVPRVRAWTTAAAGAWGAVWAALADVLTHVALHADDNDTYASVPLPEDVELVGFLPLAPALTELALPPRAPHTSLPEVPPVCLSEEPELQKRVRAHRILRLGKQIADLKPDSITYVEEEGTITFRAREVGGSELEQALEELSLAQARRAAAARADRSPDRFSDSDDDSERPPPPPPPTVISEADFREKVREKRAGILKPQGSLERAREERAMATQEDADENSEESKSDDKKESKKSRVNIAMAAIMRKQEEINKQVKFVSPPPTPDSTADNTESKEDKPKLIQPKAIKSLANLPLGRKTGGILSLKDKSAGYPHLVNNEEKKQEKEEKKETKPQPQYQNYPKRENSQTNWTPAPPQTFNEPRNFQKNYGIQNAGLSYNPNYQPPQQHQSIRLPVVNPKEIDVRTAALQKQNSRQDMFQENHKFNYQISGDKKNFLNDLPPRFANQYRYWQTPDNQFNENKFRDDSFKNSSPNMFNQRWGNPPQMDATNYQQPPWWKPENQSPNFNYPMQQQNFFTSLNSNAPNPYQNVQFNKPDQPYLPSTIGQPMQTLQSLVSSPNFNSSLSNFNSYPAVPYDSTMYPQFSNKLTFPMQKPLDIGVGFPNNIDMQRNPNFDSKPDAGPSSLEQNKVEGPSIETAGNTYSLFSGNTTAPAAWGGGGVGHHTLWSGPGSSPLERLLEHQKQMKPPSQ